MPRAKRESDEMYNARRRISRRIDRLEKRAENQTGAERERTRIEIGQLKEAREKTYVKSDATPEQREQIVKESYGTLQGAGEEALKEREADAVLKSYVGKRIFAGTVDIWQSGGTYRERLAKIMDFFKVKTKAALVDMMDKLLGESLYSRGDDDQDSRYRVASMKLRLVARKMER